MGYTGSAGGDGSALSLVGSPPVGLNQARTEAAMPQHQILTESLVDVLGEIDVAGRPASVSWPRQGDAVGIDFADHDARFGVVFALDSDPRLRVEPDHVDLLDVEGRLIVLEQVSTLWYRASAVPEAARLRRARR